MSLTGPYGPVTKKMESNLKQKHRHPQVDAAPRQQLSRLIYSFTGSLLSSCIRHRSTTNPTLNRFHKSLVEEYVHYMTNISTPRTNSESMWEKLKVFFMLNAFATIEAGTLGLATATHLQKIKQLFSISFEEGFKQTTDPPVVPYVLECVQSFQQCSFSFDTLRLVDRVYRPKDFAPLCDLQTCASPVPLSSVEEWGEAILALQHVKPESVDHVSDGYLQHIFKVVAHTMGLILGFVQQPGNRIKAEAWRTVFRTCGITQPTLLDALLYVVQDIELEIRKWAHPYATVTEINQPKTSKYRKVLVYSPFILPFLCFSVFLGRLYPTQLSTLNVFTATSHRVHTSTPFAPLEPSNYATCMAFALKEAVVAPRKLKCGGLDLEFYRAIFPTPIGGPLTQVLFPSITETGKKCSHLHNKQVEAHFTAWGLRSHALLLQEMEVGSAAPWGMPPPPLEKRKRRTLGPRKKKAYPSDEDTESEEPSEDEKKEGVRSLLFHMNPHESEEEPGALYSHVPNVQQSPHMQSHRPLAWMEEGLPEMPSLAITEEAIRKAAAKVQQGGPFEGMLESLSKSQSEAGFPLIVPTSTNLTFQPSELANLHWLDALPPLPGASHNSVYEASRSLLTLSTGAPLGEVSPSIQLSTFASLNMGKTSPAHSTDVEEHELSDIEELAPSRHAKKWKSEDPVPLGHLLRIVDTSLSDTPWDTLQTVEFKAPLSLVNRPFQPVSIWVPRFQRTKEPTLFESFSQLASENEIPVRFYGSQSLQQVCLLGHVNAPLGCRVLVEAFDLYHHTHSDFLRTYSYLYPLLQQFIRHQPSTRSLIHFCLDAVHLVDCPHKATVKPHMNTNMRLSSFYLDLQAKPLETSSWMVRSLWRCPSGSTLVSLPTFLARQKEQATSNWGELLCQCLHVYFQLCLYLRLALPLESFQIVETKQGGPPQLRLSIPIEETDVFYTYPRLLTSTEVNNWIQQWKPLYIQWMTGHSTLSIFKFVTHLQTQTMAFRKTIEGSAKNARDKANQVMDYFHMSSFASTYECVLTALVL